MSAVAPARIGIGGFLHETNTFAPSPAGLRAFEEGGGWPALCRGEAIFTGTRGVNVSAAGFIAAAQERDWTLVPTLWAAASPSGLVRREAYETIAGELVERLAQAEPLDGIYLDLHGAMVAEHLDDGEGELLRRVRRAVGPEVPIVASLDLHGNVTPAMVEAADILVAFRTYPHVDMAETGRRAAGLLAGLIGSAARPTKSFRQLPFLIPIVWQRTAAEPFREIYAELARREGGAIMSLSVLPGFPAADFPDCRPSVLAYAAGQAEADAAADALKDLIEAREVAFAGRLYQPDEAVRVALERGAPGRPVVLADAQDNPGAGSDSNTTGMLRALLAAGVPRAAIGLIVDPQAARAAHAAGVGATLRIGLGGQSGIPGDAPLEAEYRVDTLSDGRLRTGGPYYGQGVMDLGPSACLSLAGIRIVVASHKAQMGDRAMFRFVGIEPREEPILVVKSSVHFRADFEPIAGEILVCLAPGSMPMDPSLLPWTNLADGLRLKPEGPVFSRTTMRFVPIKSVEQQAALALHRTRDLLVRQRTQLVNMIRGLLAEFGIDIPKGITNALAFVRRAVAGEANEVPDLATKVISALAEQAIEVQGRLRQLERDLLASFRSNDLARRIATVPGVGLLGASAIAATVTDPTPFRSGRQFAAWLGLTPLPNSSGGRERLGRISKMGDQYLRRLLVIGMTSLLRRNKHRPDAADPRITALLARKPPRVVTVAMANRAARAIWAIMVRGEVYRMPTLGSATA